MQVYQTHLRDSTDDLAVAFADFRARVEVEFVGAVLADAVVGVAAAREAGLRLEHFSQDDCRLICMAAAWSERRGQRNALGAAEHLLRHFQLWDDSQISGNAGMRWSRRALDMLAARHFPSAAIVKALAGRVIDLHCIALMVQEYHRLTRDALEDALKPAAWHLHLGGEPAARYRGREAA